MNNRNSGGVRTSTMTYEEWDKLLDKASHIPNEKPGKDTHKSNLYVSTGKDITYTLTWFMCGSMVLYLILQNHPMLAIIQFWIFIMMVSRK